MRLRPTRTVLLVVIGVAVVLVAWVGWQVWSVNRALSAATDDATGLQQALEAGDQDAAEAALARLADHSETAADHAGGVTWSALTHLPIFGDDARGVRVVSDVVHDLSDGGINDLVASAGDLDSLVPSGGRIDLAVLEGLKSPVGSGRSALEDARSALAAEDSGSFVEAFRGKYRELYGKVDDAAEAMAAAEKALAVLPTMLGAEGPRDYLLVLQNNAEIRATGGLPGNVSVIHTDGGAITMTRQVNAAEELAGAPESVLPLTPAEDALFGDLLGKFFLDANYTPDFPRTAALMEARWEQVFGEQVDGVLSMDPVTLGYVLRAVGPVQVRDVSLNADNAVDELLHQVYLRYPDGEEQNLFFNEAARLIFDRVTAGSNPQELIRSLAQGAREQRIYVQSQDEGVATELAGAPILGEVSHDPTDPAQAGFYLNDATGSKMSYFLRYDVDIEATYCAGGQQALQGHARLQSTAPADAAETLPDYITGLYGVKPGSQLLTVLMYGPAGGTLDSVEIDGKPVEDAVVVDDDGLPIARTYVQIDPGETVDVTWAMKTASGQTGDVAVSVTPSIEGGTASSTTRSAC